MHKLHSIAKTARYAIFIVLFSLVLAIFVFAQTNVNVNATFDPTGPGTVNLSPLPQWSSSNVTLNWTAATNAVIYTVQSSTDSNFTTILYSTSTTALTTVISSVPEGILLYYRVIPYNGVGTPGIISNVVSTTSDITPPVTAITAALVNSDNTVTINYTAIDTISGMDKVYLYYRFNDSVWVNYGVIGSSPYIFSPPQSGKYDLLTIGVDNRGNIETKTLNPEATVYIGNVPIITPTPTIAPSPTTTITTTPGVTTTPNITTTPVIQKNIGINIKIYTPPYATAKIIENGIVIANIPSGINGVISSSLKVNSNTKKLLVQIFNTFGTNIYTTFVDVVENIRILTPPVFDNYYFLSDPGEIIQISGKAKPNSQIELNLPTSKTDIIKTTTTADFDGNFSFTIHTTTLEKHNFTIYAYATFDNLKSDKSNEVLLILSRDTLAKIEQNKQEETNFLKEIMQKPILEVIKLNSSTSQSLRSILTSIFMSTSVILGISAGISLLSLLALLASGRNFILIFRRGNQKGQVYDDKTKEPIPFALIDVYETLTNKLVAKSITNIQGKYKIKLPIGNNMYYMIVKHPSFKQITHKKDSYTGLYIYAGVDFVANREIDFYIPMERKTKSVMAVIVWYFCKVIKNIVLSFDLILKILIGVSILLFVITYNQTVFISLIIFLILAISLNVRISYKKIDSYIFQSVGDKVVPLDNAFVHIYAKDNSLVSTRLTDMNGNFTVNLQKGEYRAELYKPGYHIDNYSNNVKLLNSYSILLNVKNNLEIDIYTTKSVT